MAAAAACACGGRPRHRTAVVRNRDAAPAVRWGCSALAGRSARTDDAARASTAKTKPFAIAKRLRRDAGVLSRGAAARSRARLFGAACQPECRCCCDACVARQNDVHTRPPPPRRRPSSRGRLTAALWSCSCNGGEAQSGKASAQAADASGQAWSRVGERALSSKQGLVCARAGFGRRSADRGPRHPTRPRQTRPARGSPGTGGDRGGRAASGRRVSGVEETPRERDCPSTRHAESG